MLVKWSSWLIPFASNSRTRALNLINWATWIPNENGLLEYWFAGSTVDPPVAKLHPVWKLGSTTESRYGLRNGWSIASTAKPKTNQLIEIMKNYDEKLRNITQKIDNQTAVTKPPCRLLEVGLSIRRSYWKSHSGNQTTSIRIWITEVKNCRIAKTRRNDHRRIWED